MPRTVLSVCYPDGPDSFAQLVETAEAVVVARPVGDEVVIRSFDGPLQVNGQPFVIATTLKGSVPPGSKITVLRTTLSKDLGAGEPPFTRAEYILGIRRSATYPAWLTLGGSSGRIAFGGDGTAVVEDEGIAVQEEVAGKTVAELVALAQAADSPPTD